MIQYVNPNIIAAERTYVAGSRTCMDRILYRLLVLLILCAGCSPRATEPEHDVVVVPTSDQGELRLALTGAAPSADALHAARGAGHSV